MGYDTPFFKKYYVATRILVWNNLPRFYTPPVSRKIDSYLIYFSAILSNTAAA